MAWDDLSLKEKMFVFHYTNDGDRDSFNNLSQSSVRAGYGEAMGLELSKRPEVAAEVLKRHEAIIRCLEYDKSMVVSKLTQIIDKLDEIEIAKYNVSDILKAIQELSKIKDFYAASKIDVVATEGDYREDVKAQIKEYAKGF